MSKLLLEALEKRNSKTPIWIMRQAGRYLPEYNNVRKNFPNFIEFCLNSDAATEVTLQPIDKFGFDAAILFSDILIVPHALGLKVEFKKDHGPIVEKIEKEDDLKKLNVDVTVFESVATSVTKIRKKLEKSKTLIGFAGAPWTVASYIIEGGGSKDFANTKIFALQNEKTFEKLIDILTEATIKYLSLQIEAGAEVVKIFDSWAGVLSLSQFKKYVVTPTQKIVTSLNQKFPNIKIIGFPRLAHFYLSEFSANVNIDGIAVDQFTPMNWAKENCNGKVIQGNLDNYTLLSSKDVISREVRKIFEDVGSKKFIFNLGHGILPQTPVENVYHLVEEVRKYGS